MNGNKHLYIFLLVLFLTAGLRFINLGFQDLQAWDEGLYAIRAESITRYNVWLDQSTYSVGGQYALVHPPLYVWLTASAYNLFGINEFTTRLFSAILGGMTLFVIFAIGRHLADARTGFIAALLFGLNPFVTFFARQGQFDTALVFFLSVAAYFIIGNIRENSMSKAILAGAAVGLALMTKMFVGLGIPLSYLVWILFFRRDNKKHHLISLGILVGTALCIALPWHIYIIWKEGGGDVLFFFRVTDLYNRIVHGVEGNVKSLGLLYFINQLFVRFPLASIFFIYGMYRLFKKNETALIYVALWFIVFFSGFSLMKTKLAAYLLTMLIPVSLIAGREMIRLIRDPHREKTFTYLFAGTLFGVVWSAHQNWRDTVKSVLSSFARFQMPATEELLRLAPFILLGLAIPAGVYALYRFNYMNIVKRYAISLFLIPSGALIIYQVAVGDTTTYKDGAPELARFIERHNFDELIIVGIRTNPQLEYYLKGPEIGWRNDIRIERLIPPEEKDRLADWLNHELSDTRTDALLIIEKDATIRYQTVDADALAPSAYIRVFDSKRYAAFQKIPDEHLNH
jgi:hypothetical protein